MLSYGLQNAVRPLFEITDLHICCNQLFCHIERIQERYSTIVLSAEGQNHRQQMADCSIHKLCCILRRSGLLNSAFAAFVWP